MINLKIMVSDRHLGMPMTVTSDKGGEVRLLISLVTTMRYEKLQICYLLFVLILYKGITSSRFYQRAIFPHSKPLKAHITSLVNVDGDQFGRKNSETLPMSIKQERLRQATSRAHIGQSTNTKPYGRDGSDSVTHGTDQTSPIEYLL